jgi:hypothetical protein
MHAGGGQGALSCAHTCCHNVAKVAYTCSSYRRATERSISLWSCFVDYLQNFPGAFCIAKEQGQQQSFTEALVTTPVLFVKCLPFGREGQTLAESVRKNKITSKAARAFAAAVKKMRIKMRPSMTQRIAKILETEHARNFPSNLARSLQLAYAWGVAQDAVYSSAIAGAQKLVRHDASRSMGHFRVKECMLHRVRFINASTCVSEECPLCPLPWGACLCVAVAMWPLLIAPAVSLGAGRPVDSSNAVPRSLCCTLHQSALFWYHGSALQSPC